MEPTRCFVQAQTLRFTPNEVEEFRSLGLDFEGARTQDDIEQALATWAETLADERPDLLDKIVAEMAKAKASNCPAQLTVVQRRAFFRFSFGNPDPAVGDLVQIDQVVGLDLARLAQPGDHFLDQRGSSSASWIAMAAMRLR